MNKAVVGIRTDLLGDETEQLCYDLFEAIRYSRIQELRRRELEERQERLVEKLFRPQ